MSDLLRQQKQADYRVKQDMQFKTTSVNWLTHMQFLCDNTKMNHQKESNKYKQRKEQIVIPEEFHITPNRKSALCERTSFLVPTNPIITSSEPLQEKHKISVAQKDSLTLQPNKSYLQLRLLSRFTFVPNKPISQRKLCALLCLVS